MPDTPAPSPPIQADYLDALGFALSRRPQFGNRTAGSRRASITNASLADRGGSPGGLHHGELLYGQRATMLTIRTTTGAAIPAGMPGALGGGTLVQVASRASTAPEASGVRRIARSACACVLVPSRLPC